MLLNWRDHSWLHLFRRDKVVCSNITMSVCEAGTVGWKGGGRGEGGGGEKVREGKGRNNDKRKRAREKIKVCK